MAKELRLPKELEYLPLKKIKPNPNNPRFMPLGEMDKLKESIRRFGLQDPLIIDADGMLVGGHQRYLAMCEMVKEKELKIDKVPVIRFVGKPEEVLLLSVALNKIRGRFDLQQLQITMKELSEGLSPEDLQSSGFTEMELAALFETPEATLKKMMDLNSGLDIEQLRILTIEEERKPISLGAKVGERQTGIADLPMDLIDKAPWNPKILPQSRYAALKKSIEALGLGQPVLVRRREGGRYELIDGEKRFLVGQELGWESIPAQITDVDDDIAKLLNIALNKKAGFFRADILTPLLKELIDTRGQSEVAQILGWGATTLQEYIGLEDVIEATPLSEILGGLEGVVSEKELAHLQVGGILPELVVVLFTIQMSEQIFVDEILKQFDPDPSIAFLAALHKLKDLLDREDIS